MKVPVANRVTIIYKIPVCKCNIVEYEKYMKEEDQQNKEREKEKKRIEMEDKQIKLDKLKKYSMMDQNFLNSTFENWELTKTPQNIKEIGLKYVAKWEEIRSKNNGLLIWGVPGNGKSYLSFCIANALLEQYIPVIAISTIGLLNRIKDTYKKWGKEGETEIINSLNNASLLVLDDIGAEANTDWTKEKLYEIIDTRYRSHKPTIATTNLNPDELRIKLTGLDEIDRTYDRLIEMCTPMELKGESKRRIIAQEKEEEFRKMFR